MQYHILCSDFCTHICCTCLGHQIQFGWCLLVNTGFQRFVLVLTNDSCHLVLIPWFRLLTFHSVQLSGIAKMFSSEMTLASAWIHLLAVDLFAARSLSFYLKTTLHYCKCVGLSVLVEEMAILSLYKVLTCCTILILWASVWSCVGARR